MVFISNKAEFWSFSLTKKEQNPPTKKNPHQEPQTKIQTNKTNKQKIRKKNELLNISF